jgi:hypothetical protein
MRAALGDTTTARQAWDQIPSASDNRVLVIKAHVFETRREKEGMKRLREMANRTVVFMTSRGDNVWPPTYNAMHGLTVVHVTPTTHVAKQSFRADMDDYQRIFGLDDEQVEVLVEWLEAWGVIRVCCGTQMSDSWRHQLVPSYVPHGISFISKGSTNDVAVAAEGLNHVVQLCASTNISEAEANVMNTRLYKKMYHRVPFLGRASGRDEPLTGDYCETCNANVGSGRTVWACL